MTQRETDNLNAASCPVPHNKRRWSTATRHVTRVMFGNDYKRLLRIQSCNVKVYSSVLLLSSLFVLLSAWPFSRTLSKILSFLFPGMENSESIKRLKPGRTMGERRQSKHDPGDVMWCPHRAPQLSSSYEVLGETLMNSFTAVVLYEKLKYCLLIKRRLKSSLLLTKIINTVGWIFCIYRSNYYCLWLITGKLY